MDTRACKCPLNYKTLWSVILLSGRSADRLSSTVQHRQRTTPKYLCLIDENLQVGVSLRQLLVKVLHGESEAQLWLLSHDGRRKVRDATRAANVQWEKRPRTCSRKACLRIAPSKAWIHFSLSSASRAESRRVKRRPPLGGPVLTQPVTPTPHTWELGGGAAVGVHCGFLHPPKSVLAPAPSTPQAHQNQQHRISGFESQS